jgi:hypothetical protein
MNKFTNAYTLAGFEPAIFCSVSEDHYTSPSGPIWIGLETIVEINPSCTYVHSTTYVNAIRRALLKVLFLGSFVRSVGVVSSSITELWVARSDRKGIHRW